MFQTTQRQCHKCKGVGEVIRDGKKCKTCNGNKTVNKTIDLNIPIPKGVENNFKMIVKGHGHCINKNKPGDLIVFIRILPPTSKEKGWTRKNQDLYYDMDINLVDALCDFQKVLVHLDGKNLLFKSENVVKPNQVTKIEGEGMPFVNNDRKGDLYLKFNIIFPNTVGKGSKDKLKTLFPKSENVQIKSLKDSKLYKI